MKHRIRQKAAEKISPREAYRRRKRREEELPYALFIGTCLLLVLLLSFWLQRDRSEGDWRLLTEADSSAALSETSREEGEERSVGREREGESFPVYLSGAVQRPGIYQAEAGDIVAQLLEKAGGFREEPHSEKVNLAETVRPHEQIYFPFLSEGENSVRGEETDGRLDIRSCSKEELLTVPGIGPATAEAILRFRESGKLQKVEDLLQVPGIKERRFTQIRDYFR